MIDGKTMYKAEELFTIIVGRNSGKTAKGVLNTGAKAEQRLFTIKHDARIGTEIQNNLTGTRFTSSGGLNNRDVQVGALPRRINEDGTSEGISPNAFERLLHQLRTDREGWNPILKGQKGNLNGALELQTNFDGLRRFIRTPFSGDQVTCVHQDGRYSSMSLKQLDDMILKLSEMAGK